MASLFRSTGIKTTVAMMFFSTLVFSQNYSPFNATVTKRFYNSAAPSDNDYFYYAESSQVIAPGVTAFSQYFSLKYGTNANASSCGFWAAGPTFLLDTTWLGAVALYDSNNQHLKLENEEGVTMTFDFSLAPGDSAKFFENATDRYFIKAGATQLESVYTIPDSVKNFTILHYDVNNSMVNSTLHGKQVKLAKQLGLISFIDAYHLPALEKHLMLQGQLNPPIGTYQVRMEDIFPFQVGDSLQFVGTGGETSVCEYVRTYRVASRQETATDVTIGFTKTYQHITPNVPANVCPPLDVYPDQLTFKKNSELLDYPVNRHTLDPGLSYNGDDDAGYEFRKADSGQTICGKMPRYVGESEPMMFCNNCGCVGQVDAFKYTQGIPERHYVEGMGIVFYGLTGWTMGASNLPWQKTIGLTYSSIGGATCGTYRIVGMSDHQREKLSVYPNPVRDVLSIGGSADEVRIFGVDGEKVGSLSKPGATVDVRHLHPGIYMLQVRRGDKTGYARFVKL